LAWCSQNSTCDDIGPTSCAQLRPARNALISVQARPIGTCTTHSSLGASNAFTVL
jgi:hypothetical protein